MTRYLAFIFILLTYTNVCVAQTSAKDFEKYARIQDSLQVDAYHKKDVKGFEKLKKQFEKEYNKLDEKD